MNINEYIRAIFNEATQNFNVSDYVYDFRKYLSVYADNYGFEGNIEGFITDFNAEINEIRKVFTDEVNRYIDELEKIDKHSNNYDDLFEEWYENVTLYKIISKKMDNIHNKYMDITKNQNDDFRLKFKKLIDESFDSLDKKVMNIEGKVKSEIAIYKGRKLSEDRINDKLFNSVQYDIPTDSFRVLDKQEFYFGNNSENASYKFDNRYFNKIFCKKYNDDLFLSLETDMGVKQLLMINNNGFAYIDNEKNVRAIFDYETVNFVTSNSNVVYNVNDAEKMNIAFKLLEQIDINLVHMIKNKLAIKKSSELSTNVQEFQELPSNVIK